MSTDDAGCRFCVALSSLTAHDQTHHLYDQIEARGEAMAQVIGVLTYWLEDHQPAGDVPDKLRVALGRMRETLQAGLVRSPCGDGR